MNKKAEITLEELVRLIPKIVLFLVLLSIFIAIWLVVNPFEKSAEEKQLNDIKREIMDIKNTRSISFPLLFLTPNKNYTFIYFYFSSVDNLKLTTDDKNFARDFPKCKLKPQGCICLIDGPRGSQSVTCTNFEQKNLGSTKTPGIITGLFQYYTLNITLNDSDLVFAGDVGMGGYVQNSALAYTYNDTNITDPGISYDDSFLGDLQSRERVKGYKIKKIVIHNTKTGYVDDAIYQWVNLPNYYSVHYIIEKDGEVYYIIDESRNANHISCSTDNACTTNCCTSDPPIVTGDNSIAISLVNSGDGSDDFEDYQYEALKELLDKLKTRYALTENDIIGTCQVIKGEVDPANNFDWTKIGLNTPSCP